MTKACVYCSTEFRRPPSQAHIRFCSAACVYAHRREHGFTRNRVPFTCPQCNQTVTMTASRAAKRTVCSRKCEDARRAAWSPEQWPRFRSRVSLTCEWCHNSFSTQRSWVKKENRGRFCSGSCRAAWVSHCRQNRVSKTEIRFVKALRDHGFAFETQQRFSHFTVDVLFPSERVVVEFDGDYWHRQPRMIDKDARKDIALMMAGYSVVRVLQTEFARNPDRVMHRIRAALMREVAA